MSNSEWRSRQQARVQEHLPHWELADEVCDQPAQCATYDRWYHCTRCGYPANCHEA